MSTLRRMNWRAVGKTATAAAAMAAVDDLTNIGTKARQAFRNTATRWAYLLRVLDTDPIYRDVHDTLLTQVPSAQLRRLTIHYNTQGLKDDTARVGDADPILHEYEDPTRSHPIVIGGETIRVRFGVHAESPPSGKTVVNINRYDMAGDTITPKHIEFKCWTPRQRDAVTAFLADVARNHHTREHPPAFNVVGRWGEWRQLDHVPRRDVNSVILPDGQMGRIVADVEAFLGQRARYEQLGLPWHRGYLFEGPPGTGKSSIPRALATHFNLDVWHMPLGDIKGDTSLIALVSDIKTGGILLLEDVDVFAQAQRRTETDDEPGGDPPPQDTTTLSGLLNAIDGISTPPGLIVCMTTNNLAALDPALFRPGRIDVVEHIGPVTAQQAADVFRWFYGTDPTVPFIVDGTTTVADLIEVMKHHFDAPDTGEKAVHAKFAEKAVDGPAAGEVSSPHAYRVPMAPTPSGSEVARN